MVRRNFIHLQCRKGVVSVKKFTKKVLAVFLSVLMAVCAVAMPASAAQTHSKSFEKTAEKVEYVEGEAIVVLKDTAPKTYLKASKAAANFGAGISLDDSFTFTKKNGTIKAAVLKSLNKSTKTLIKELKKNNQVKSVFPNYKVKASAITNDTYSDFQWALDNKGQSGGIENNDVNAEGLWDSAAASEKEQVVAIIDTGIDFEHEDLKDIVWNNPYGSKLVGKHGYDFSDTIKDHTPLDDNGHGTHVAGIIAGAADNEKGISGINKSNIKLMACKFLDEDGSGTIDAALASYEYISRAVDLGTNIVAINNSWGGVGDSEEQALFDELFDALGEKGVVTTVAAGNDGMDLENVAEEYSFLFDDEADILVTPASSESKYCLTVGASNEKDELADFSNYSKKYVDVSAPGTDILSSVSYNCFNPTIYSAEQRNALVSDMQDYEGEVDESSFGYPKLLKPCLSEKNENYEYVGKVDPVISLCDDGFDKSSKSIRIKSDEEISEDEDSRLYAFEIPYTIEDENKPYSFSFMIKANNDTMGFVADVPADYDYAENYEDAPMEFFIFGGTTGNYWSHKFLNVDPSEKKGYDKKMKSRERKLVFYFSSYKTGTTIQIDDLAISKQDINEDDFEKYDFYNGTSMATPYVTGAVALVKNAYPDASTAEIINIVKNTGREVEALREKTENGRVLSLENTDKTPPMIVSAKYNADGDVEVDGSFKNDAQFKINGEAVTPKSVTETLAVFEDNSYNTKKAVIDAENAFGSDSISILLANKPAPEMSPKVIGSPMMNITSGYYMPQGSKSIPAGDKSYFVSDTGEVGSIYYDILDEAYVYDDMIPQIEIMSLFKNPKNVSIKDAVYLNGKIYFEAVNEVNSDYTGTALGYDGAFGYLDLAKGETKVLCETPDPAMLGSSLAVYNGNIYIIGGYDSDNNAFSSDVYKYNTSSKAFDKTEFALPEGRAFTRFLQFGNTLVGVYGSVESGKLPQIIKFDGSAWSTSAVEAESEDYDRYFFYTTEKEINVYYGNVGYSSSGLYLNGAYIYGIGDTYIYNVSKDNLTASKYSFTNEIGKNKVFATTLPGCFIAYPVPTEDDIFGVGAGGDVISPVDDDNDENSCVAYCVSIKNSYAQLDDSELANAYISSEHNQYYAYGDKATIQVKAESGYVLTSVTVDGVKLASGTTKKTVTFNKSKITVAAQTKRVSPNKVTGLKVALDLKKKNYNVSWKKPTRAQGYQIQSYVGGAWKTVKTISSGSTLKCTIAKSKTGKKFRVRAYAKYNGKTYYGAWSSTVTVK